MNCPHCHDTKCLTYKGIFQIYLRPKMFYLLLAGISAAGAFFLTPYLYILSCIFFLLPLAQADMRLYLFLPVLSARLLGKKVNCPKCNPSGAIFRSPFAEAKGRDRFME